MPTWEELKPAGGDLLSELPSVLTNNKVAFRTAVEKHSFWTDSSGVSAGVPRLSSNSFGPGAARAFFDIASSASTALSTTKPLGGRLYVTSDTSRLLAYPATTAPLQVGTKQCLVYIGASTATIPSNVRVRTEAAFTLMSNSTSTTPFASTYVTPPTVQIHALSANTLSFGIPLLLASGTTNFTCRVVAIWGGPSFNVFWRSFGTVTL